MISRKLSFAAQADLFKNGTVIFHHPYKIFFTLGRTNDMRPGCTIIISVPKRNFKRAVDRNRIKRQIREVFRLNYMTLSKELPKYDVQINILCLYLPNEHTATAVLSDKMESLLARLTQHIAQRGAVPAPGID